MKVLGVNLLQGELRYSLITGVRGAPQLVDRGRRIVVSEDSPELMDWFESTFDEIIDSTKPDKLAYRLVLNPKKKQIYNLIFPFAILNLVAHRKKIAISEYINQNFTPTKFGYPKGEDIYEICTAVFGEHPPYWDKNQKYSVIVAWLSLSI